MQAWEFDFTGNCAVLTEFLLNKEKDIIESFKQEDVQFAIPTTDRFYHYNTFTLVNSEVNKLYKNIYQAFAQLKDELNLKDEFYIQSWYNISRDIQLDWHIHYPYGINSFHGFLAVDTEPSFTEYQVDNEILRISNKNGRIFLAESGYSHRVSGWNEKRPRVSIAWDIVTAETIEKNYEINHWIPI